ncbi:hypothetical protein ZTR_09580 [Talaromyces verruculosus]|nr:hypothetical protein ZTR_09580 [Talaromyces verruculosus]
MDFTHSVFKFRDDVWRLDITEIDVQNLLDSVSRLQTQLEVQGVLSTTETLLRSHPSDKALPSHQATRIKHFLKFVFEKISAESSRNMQLRNLDCSSLKLCGLSYTVREIVELPSRTFDFLVQHVSDFVQSRGLSLLLCRDDINKVVLGDFDPQDDELFKKFLTEHIELRLAQRKRQQISSTPGQDATGFSPSTVHESHEQTLPVKRTRTEGELLPSTDEQILPLKRTRTGRLLQREDGIPGRQIQYMYSKTPLAKIPRFYELLPEAMESSSQWEMERRLSESTTDCITTMVPTDPQLDMSITMWVGQEAGVRMIGMLSQVPKWTSSPNRAEP